MTDLKQDLIRILNQHCAENESGTPDFILGEYLMGCLVNFEQAVCHRAKWRGEEVEFHPTVSLDDHCESDSDDEPEDATDLIPLEPGEVITKEAAEAISDKEVPLVIYTDGMRNEIGTAKVSITPGEMAVTGTITGAVGIFEQPLHEGQYSINVSDAPPLDDTLSRFDRYIRKGLSPNA